MTEVVPKLLNSLVITYGLYFAPSPDPCPLASFVALDIRLLIAFPSMCGYTYLTYFYILVSFYDVIHLF